MPILAVAALCAGFTTPNDVPAGPVYPASNLTQAAKVLYRPEPQLPERLRKRGIDGYVMIEGIIGTDGRFRAAHVTKYDVHSLIEPALENIAQWRFEPARIGDVPVNTHFEFVIDFRPHRRGGERLPNGFAPGSNLHLDHFRLRRRTCKCPLHLAPRIQTAVPRFAARRFYDYPLRALNPFGNYVDLGEANLDRFVPIDSLWKRCAVNAARRRIRCMQTRWTNHLKRDLFNGNWKVLNVGDFNARDRIRSGVGP
jgi:hypothetical protein